MKKFILSTLIFTLLFSTSFIYANDLYGSYPSRGYATLSKGAGYGNAIFATSDNCNDSETNAFIKVRSSTEQSTEMGRWPLGIIMQQSTCTGTVANDIDIFLDYSDWSVTHAGDTTSGGENHSTAAPSSYCTWKVVSYPCGSHPSTVHLSINKWNSQTTTWRERLIMHETSHSMGLAHHCTGDSITNSGASSCNGGKWTQIMSYQATDRSGISSQYPN